MEAVLGELADRCNLSVDEVGAIFIFDGLVKHTGDNYSSGFQLPEKMRKRFVQIAKILKVSEEAVFQGLLETAIKEEPNVSDLH